MPKIAVENLEPKILWQRFYEISRIPRPSKKEEKIRAYLRNLFRELNVEFKEDSIGNIVAKIPASKGFENSPAVILQGHVDMVCEKNNSKKHDFETDPIEIYREDGWIKADGTTLGSDNGIGVAAALAVISDKNVIHGPLEILLTVDEETGLTGASNFDPNLISGKILINMDSEEEGTFYIGCAGGQDTLGKFILEFENKPHSASLYELTVTGLKGGHSGLEIRLARANAIKILGRVLNELQKINFSIAKLNAGKLRNAIPREAEAIIYLNDSNEKNAQDIINNFQKLASNEFKKSDKDLKITLQKITSKDLADSENKVFTKILSKKIINTLLALPNGVISWSQDIPDLVETSTNVATIKISGNELIIGTSQRSSIESAKKYAAKSTAAVFDLASAEIKTTDGYPGWKPNMDSKLLKVATQTYKELFNKEAEIKAIHAGLECGILESKKPGMDMVSFGPTIEGAHSPDEKVNIETVEKFYDLLKSLLKELAVQNKN